MESAPPAAAGRVFGADIGARTTVLAAPLTEGLFRLVNKIRYFVCVFWVLAFFGCAVFSRHILKACTQAIKPPTGSEALAASAAMQKCPPAPSPLHTLHRPACSHYARVPTADLAYGPPPPPPSCGQAAYAVSLGRAAYFPDWIYDCTLIMYITETDNNTLPLVSPPLSPPLATPPLHTHSPASGLRSRSPPTPTAGVRLCAACLTCVSTMRPAPQFDIGDSVDAANILRVRLSLAPAPCPMSQGAHSPAARALRTDCPPHLPHPRTYRVTYRQDYLAELQNVSRGPYPFKDGKGKPVDEDLLLGFSSYYNLPPGLGSEFMDTVNYTSTIVDISLKAFLTNPISSAFATWFQNEAIYLYNRVDPDKKAIGSYANQMKTHNHTISFSLTGAPAFIPTLTESVMHDFEMLDGVCTPMALIVLAFILHSWRLMLLPVFNILLSIDVAFFLMYFAAKEVEVFITTPSMMMSMTIAISIDYSLFLFSRFREELIASPNASVKDSVRSMQASAGHTITVSGITLAVCFFGLMMFWGVKVMASLGIGCGVAVVVTLVVNLTMTPAVMLSFPNFYKKCITDKWPDCCVILCCTPGGRRPKDEDSGDETDEEDVNTPMDTPLLKPVAHNVAAIQEIQDAGAQVKNGTQGSLYQVQSGSLLNSSSLSLAAASVMKADYSSISGSFWYKVGRHVITWPNNLYILIICMLITLLTGFLLHFH
eukprot:gene11892-2168_t